MDFGIVGIESGEHLLWCIALGFMVACVYAFFAKCVTGKLIRGLAREDACSEESALLLSQIGCKSGIYRFALRKGASLAESVIAVDTETDEKRYYLKPEDKEKMLLKYGAGSGSLVSLLLTLLAAFIVAAVAAIMLPVITEIFRGL